ncbi:uncharacterized protein P884DRAFT_109122 [Thermothelomyces heterothallicus CBS 202.75]|uniref:uncharacterized protein n=1 Tax=Thermothelomyces heterothallicus CBS 202.75 TaxID=1149848 RepID=UPI00374470A4
MDQKSAQIGVFLFLLINYSFPFAFFLPPFCGTPGPFRLQQASASPDRLRLGSNAALLTNGTFQQGCLRHDPRARRQWIAPLGGNRAGAVIETS